MFEVDTRNLTELEDIRPVIGLTTGSWITLCVYNCLIIVLGVVGNCVVLHSSLLHNAIKFDKVTLLLVHSLAVADLMLILLVFAPMWTTLLGKSWVLGENICWFLGYFFAVPIVYEVLTVFVMSVYRFWLITRIVRYREEIVLRVVKTTLVAFLLALIGVQIYLAIVGYPPFFKPDLLICMSSIYKTRDTNGTILSVLNLLLTVVPTISMCVLNAGLALKLHFHGAKVNKSAPRRTLVALGLVTWCFALSYSFAVGHLVLEKLTGQKPWYELTMMYLLGTNTVCNPIIYLATNKRFRNFVIRGKLTHVFNSSFNDTPAEV